MWQAREGTFVSALEYMQMYIMSVCVLAYKCPHMSSYVAGESAFVNALEIHNLQAFDHLLPSSVRAQETGKSRTHLSV